MQGIQEAEDVDAPVERVSKRGRGRGRRERGRGIRRPRGRLGPGGFGAVRRGRGRPRKVPLLIESEGEAEFTDTETFDLDVEQIFEEQKEAVVAGKGEVPADFLVAFFKSEATIDENWGDFTDLRELAKQELPAGHPRWRALKAALEAKGTEVDTKHAALWKGVAKRTAAWYATVNDEDILLFAMWAWARGKALVKEWIAVKKRQPNCEDLEEIFRHVIEQFWHGPARDNPR